MGGGIMCLYLSLNERAVDKGSDVAKLMFFLEAVSFQYKSCD